MPPAVFGLLFVRQKGGNPENLPYFCSVFNDNRMEWLKELLVEHSALQAVVVISLISTIGIGLGKIRFFGISLGVAFIFSTLICTEFEVLFCPSATIVAPGMV